jgi:hypothetical protein
VLSETGGEVVAAATRPETEGSMLCWRIHGIHPPRALAFEVPILDIEN